MVNENGKGQGAWYIPALSIFSEISGWIAGPIVLALIAGKALDTRYGTKPMWLLILAGVGFAITIYGITKSVRKFAAKTRQQAKEQTQREQK